MGGACPPKVLSGGRAEIGPEMGARGMDVEEKRCFRPGIVRRSRREGSRAGVAELGHSASGTPSADFVAQFRAGSTRISRSEP